jgi:hypothetical protein
MTHTESTPITARYVVTFGSYDDAFELGSYASEDAALIAAAQHCRTHIEMWHRMPDPFTVERVEDHEPTPTSFDERALAEGDATAAERANAARSWLLDAIDDRPEGAYEGRFFAGEVPIFEYLLSLVPIELEADEQATDEGVCPFCDETHELFFDDVREHDAARDRARAAREDAAPQPAPFDERVLAESDAITDMTGMAVTSTAAVLAIRAAVQYRADQAQARYLAAQHGSYEVGRGRAMVARDTWREALALVDTVIAERMS